MNFNKGKDESLFIMPAFYSDAAQELLKIAFLRYHVTILFVHICVFMLKNHAIEVILGDFPYRELPGLCKGDWITHVVVNSMRSSRWFESGDFLKFQDWWDWQDGWDGNHGNFQYPDFLSL